MPTKDELFEEYEHLLFQWNETHNLTAIKREDFYIRHILESLSLSQIDSFQNATTIADIGSGAGFPGIPLKISHPEKDVFLIESVGKKAEFLRAVVSRLKLTGVEILEDRAEHLGRDEVYRGKFDIVTARAVAELPILVELAMPLLKQGGALLAFKGQSFHSELSSAASIIQEIGGGEQREHRIEYADEKQALIFELKSLGEVPSRFPRTPARLKRERLS